MTERFRPRLDILPAPQRTLWSELGTLPSDFVLYGGTAVALYLGHRQSVDFDIFTARPIDPRVLLDELRLLKDAVVTQVEPNTLSVIVDRGGPVKMSFFGVPKLGRVREPLVAEDIGLRVAHALDLGGAKASFVQVRAEPRDYIDIDALISSGLPLAALISAGSVLYGPAFSAQAALKAVAYVDDPLLASLGRPMKDRLRAAVRETSLDSLPDLRPVMPRSE